MKSHVSFTFCFCFLLLICFLSTGFSEESVCANVKFEIIQELTLERQAFDAKMKITNSLTNSHLSQVKIEVLFTDSDGNPVVASSDANNPDAKFFLRVDSMTGVSALDGTGTLPASSTAEIHWLIIPSPGASNGLPTGQLYFVGARLSYHLLAEENVTDVSPDKIFVLPMPELTLDYFFPVNVYGDDSLTSPIEPSIPFSLGVLVKNSGFGTARNLKINSAQVNITENNQNLPVTFQMLGTEVNGVSVNHNLLLDFGNIEAGHFSAARWNMTSSLTGEFTSFSAKYQHSDELGGELTSLINAVNSHSLIHDVWVDLPGRDTVRDFLAIDGLNVSVFETDTEKSAVQDMSSVSTLSLLSQDNQTEIHRLTFSPQNGFVYASVLWNKPNLQLTRAVRSDGKILNVNNVWISQNKKADLTFEYFANIFDVNSTGDYTLTFSSVTGGNQAPVIEAISPQTKGETENLSFNVVATDPDGTLPAFYSGVLPVGASFQDNHNGTATFSWTPTVGQAGDYVLHVTTTDGSLTHSRDVNIHINPIWDKDGDQMNDDWEIEHFGDMSRDGSGDFDGDGLSDVQEFLNGSDPSESSPPSMPDIISPELNSSVNTLLPEYTVLNSTDPDMDTVRYDFEIFADASYRNTMDSGLNITEAELTTAWVQTNVLTDHSHYFWRVRAKDSVFNSEWALGAFFVNMQNETPEIAKISYPENGSEVSSVTPLLNVLNVLNEDRDDLQYRFEIYSDQALTNQALVSPWQAEGENGHTAWRVNMPLEHMQTYYWKVRVQDSYGETSETAASSFTVNTLASLLNPPQFINPLPGAVLAEPSVTAEVSGDWGSLEIFYAFELDKTPSFNTGSLLSSGLIQDAAYMFESLSENTQYYLRVKVTSGLSHSEWQETAFFVNETQEAPLVPVIKSPSENTLVNTLTPSLVVFPVLDPDGDQVSYHFELYKDTEPETLVYSSTQISPVLNVPVSLDDREFYTWSVKAMDTHGLESAPSLKTRFFVKEDPANAVPEIHILSDALVTHAHSVTLAWEDIDSDSDALISFYYRFENMPDEILIEEGISENNEDDNLQWNISALSEGTYHLIAVIDDGENSTRKEKSAFLTIDRTPPVVFVSPEHSLFDAQVSVTLSANENSIIYFSLDGTEAGIYSAKYDAPVILKHSTLLRAVAIDSAGNKSAEIQKSFQKFSDLNTTLSLTDHPQWSNSSALTWEYAADVNALPFIENYTLVLNDSQTFTTSDTSFTLDNLENGQHSLTVLANFKSMPVLTGNGSNDYFGVDTALPVISVSGIENGETYVGILHPEIHITDVDSGVNVEQITLDGEAYSANTPIVAFGDHVLHITATDYAGNSSSLQLNFSILPATEPPLLQTALPVLEDAFIGQGFANKNQGGAGVLIVSKKSNQRSLLKFDMAEAQAIIEDPVLLSSATLSLGIKENDGKWEEDDNTVSVHSLLENWVEGSGWTEGNPGGSNSGSGQGVTWNCPVDENISNNKKDGNEWEMGKPDQPELHPFEEEPVDEAHMQNDMEGTVEWDVTDDVLNAFSGQSYFGWLLKKENESAKGEITFHSKESSEQFSPKLILEYKQIVAFSETLDAPSNNALTIQLKGKVLGDAPLSFYISESPQNGTLGELTVIDAQTAEITYTPTDNFSGEDTLHFMVYTGELVSSPATVHINVLSSTLQTVNVSADTFVQKGAKNTNEGASPMLRIRKKNHNMVLVKTALSDIQNAIGLGELESAELQVEIFKLSGKWQDEEQTIGIHRLTTDWIEGTGWNVKNPDGRDRGFGTGATWNCPIDEDIANHKKDGTVWDMKEAHASSVPWEDVASSAVTLNKNMDGIVKWDVTADVFSFLSGEYQNFGWLIKKENSALKGNLLFVSKDSALGCKPRLVLKVKE